ncbi:MAG: HYR domain-containing protein [Saprospiraceae bacterium]|nr:HYR domain-containing protein [Saprospiraceae bacterium]
MLIQDKLPPVLTCTGATILCTQPSGPQDAGTISLTDNCDPDPELLLTYEAILPLPCDDPNQFIQQIERRWIATDASGNTSPTCTQIIHIRRATFFNVTFPSSLFGPNALDCATADLDPSITGTPEVFGEPTAPLCKILFSYMDDTTATCPGGMFVTRTWTALDCCTGDMLTANQVIEVVDQVPPVITCPPNITISTDDNVCTTTVTLDTAQATDACSPTITFSVSTSWGGNGYGPFPNIKEGGYKVHYTATDACLNSATCTIDLVVKDLVPPKAICHNPVFSFLNGQGSDTIFVADVDAGSLDNCTMIMGQIKFMGEPDSLFRDSLITNCEFIGVDTMIVLRVEDCWGNASFCMAPLIVLDTLPPFLTCPNDTVLSCVAYQLYPDLSPLAVATDNCTFDSLTYVDIEEIDPCHVGTITRVFTAEDAGGNIVQCTQIMTLVDTTAPVIIWPADISVDCATPLDPVNTGQPDVTDDCALLAAGFVDSVAAMPGCDILYRKWRVKDWCTDYDTMYVQRLFLTDDIPLIPIDCPDDITVFVDESCTAEVQLDTVVAFDECGHFIRVTNNSPFSNTKGADASGTYPIGEHLVMFTISDACNDAFCELTISVRDNTPPILLCHPLIDCIDADSTYLLNAFDMIDSLDDVCSTLSLMVSQTMFDCDDILQDIPITITATDAAGNQTTCIDTLFLNNCDVCVKSITDGGVQLSGKVVRWDGTPIDKVPVELKLGIYSDWTTTNADGEYLSPVYPPGINVTVKAYPVLGDLEGLTTADILAIAGHLVGSKPIGTMESILAADVNQSKEISISDLITLRKSILHQISGFKAGYWRMMPFEMEIQPDTLGFPAGFWGGYYHLENVQSNLSDLTFKGIKAGDVDMSSSLIGGLFPHAERRAIEIQSARSNYLPGSQIRLPFRLDDQGGTHGFQMALGYDPSVVPFDGLQRGALSTFGPEHLAATEPGIIRISWDNLLFPIDIQEEPMFYLTFTALSPIEDENWLWMASTGYPAESYDGEERTIPLKLIWQHNAQDPLPIQDALYNPEPNPFRDRTWIPIDLAEEGPLELSIIHTDGQVLQVSRHFLPAGRHRMELDNLQLPGAGLYYCKLKTPRGIYYRSMIYQP